MRVTLRASLALLILAFLPGAFDSFVEPKWIVLCASGLGLLACMLVSGAAPLPRSRAQTVAAWAVAALIAITVASTFTSVSPRLSVIGELAQREGLLTALALAGFFAAAWRSHAHESDARRTMDVVLAASAGTALFAIVQWAGLDPIRWSEPMTYAAAGRTWLRPVGTLGNANLLGVVLAAGFAANWGRMLAGTWPRSRAVPFAWLVGAAMLATLSRGAWLAAFAGAGVATIRAARGRGLRRAEILAGIAAAAGLVVWGAVALGPAIAGRVGERAASGGTSGEVRVAIARAALAIARRYPWLGGGPDTFGLLEPSVQRTALWRHEWIGVPSHAHASLLQLLATLGIPGALAALVAALAVSVAAWRARPGAAPDGDDRAARAGALAALLVAALVNPPGLAGAALLAAVAGMVLARESAHAPGDASPRLPRAALVIGAAVALCAMIAGAWSLRASFAAARARDAMEETAGGRAEAASTAAHEAATAAALAPGEETFARLACDASLALVREARANRDTIRGATALAAAFENAGRAASLGPRRAANVLRLAEAEAEAAHAAHTREDSLAALARMDQAFAEAADLAPVDGWRLVEEARAQLELRRAVPALAAAVRLRELYPEAAIGHALEASACLLENDRARAVACLRRALAARWEQDAGRERARAQAMLRALGS